MTETAVTLQPAFILQHRHYRETSLLLDLFTRDYGIVDVIAKGVRKTKSKSVGLLLPFKALTVSYYGKTDLKTLTQVELQENQSDLYGLALYCGFYLNELLGRFCHKHDPHPEVYGHYVTCLQQLHCIVAKPDIAHGFTLQLQLESVLRIFELNLMQDIGLAPPFDHDCVTEKPIASDARYHFLADQGAVAHIEGAVSGSTLLAMNERFFSDTQSLSEAKKIMRAIINFHLQDRPLKSRLVLSKVYQQFYS